MSNARKPQTRGALPPTHTVFFTDPHRCSCHGMSRPRKGDRCGGGAYAHPLKQGQQSLPSLGRRGGPASAGGREKKTPLSPGRTQPGSSEASTQEGDSKRESSTPNPGQRARPRLRPGGQKPPTHHHSGLDGSCYGRAKAQTPRDSGTGHTKLGYRSNVKETLQ